MSDQPTEPSTRTYRRIGPYNGMIIVETPNPDGGTYWLAAAGVDGMSEQGIAVAFDLLEGNLGHDIDNGKWRGDPYADNTIPTAADPAPPAEGAEPPPRTFRRVGPHSGWIVVETPHPDGGYYYTRAHLDPDASEQAFDVAFEMLETELAESIDNGGADVRPGPAPEADEEPGATEFAAVVDELREQYRPGVPDDQVPVITHVAFCPACAAASDVDPPVAIPFGSEAERDGWAVGHADTRDHVVTLATQQPGAGTTIIGHAAPDAPGTAPARGAAPVKSAPLLAFVVPEGGPPDMLCRIPNRAGAAWLLTAAYSCLLGRSGSSGIPEPHRVLYVGRITETQYTFEVRVDGLLGATDPMFGRAIGDRFTVSRNVDLPGVEDAVEESLSRRHLIPRHLFSVVLMADAPPNDPPDPGADEFIRDLTRARRNYRPVLP